MPDFLKQNFYTIFAELKNYDKIFRQIYTQKVNAAIKKKFCDRARILNKLKKGKDDNFQSINKETREMKACVN